MCEFCIQHHKSPMRVAPIRINHRCSMIVSTKAQVTALTTARTPTPIPFSILKQILADMTKKALNADPKAFPTFEPMPGFEAADEKKVARAFTALGD